MVALRPEVSSSLPLLVKMVLLSIDGGGLSSDGTLVPP